MLNNVAEKLHNLVKFIKLKTDIFSKTSLDCCFRKLSEAFETYWFILKSSVNGKNIRSVPLILVKDQLVTNFFEKANLFHEFFTQQCNTIENDNALPNDLVFDTT